MRVIRGCRASCGRRWKHRSTCNNKDKAKHPPVRSLALIPRSALSDPGRVRFNTNASYYIKIVSNLKWNMSFYGNWDNRPPPGFSGSDYGTSSGLSWTFGLK